MSTRCQIGIYDKDAKDLNDWVALIYRHCDGYPSGVIPDIQPFLKKFHDERGLSDTEYAAGALVVFLASHHCGKPRDRSDILAVGICREFHGDVEYFYAVSETGLDVYKCGYQSAPESWKKIVHLAIGAVPKYPEE